MAKRRKRDSRRKRQNRKKTASARNNSTAAIEQLERIPDELCDVHRRYKCIGRSLDGMLINLKQISSDPNVALSSFGSADIALEELVLKYFEAVCDQTKQAVEDTRRIGERLNTITKLNDSFGMPKFPERTRAANDSIFLWYVQIGTEKETHSETIRQISMLKSAITEQLDGCDGV